MKKLAQVLKALAGALLLIGVLLTFAAVIARRVFNNSIIWSEEAVRYMFIWMFFLAMPICTMKGEHIALDILGTHIHGRAKSIYLIIVEVICIVLDIAIVKLGFPYALGNMNQKSAALHIPYGYINIAIPIGALLMIIFSIYRIYLLATGKVDPEAASEDGKEEQQ